MATPAQIANDLAAKAALWEGRHLSGHGLGDVAATLRRGAATIRGLLDDLDRMRAERDR